MMPDLMPAVVFVLGFTFTMFALPALAWFLAAIWRGLAWLWHERRIRKMQQAVRMSPEWRVQNGQDWFKIQR